MFKIRIPINTLFGKAYRVVSLSMYKIRIPINTLFGKAYRVIRSCLYEAYMIEIQKIAYSIYHH